MKSAKAKFALTLLSAFALLGGGAVVYAAKPNVPAPTITSAPANPTSSTAASFSFTDSQPGVSFQCSLDNAAFAACASPKAYTVSAGTHTFQVRAVSGNQQSAATARTWTVDTTHRRPPRSTASRLTRPIRPLPPSCSPIPSPGSVSSASSTRPPTRPARARRPTPGSRPARTPSRFRRATRQATRAPLRPTHGRSCHRRRPSAPSPPTRPTRRRRRSASASRSRAGCRSPT